MTVGTKLAGTMISLFMIELACVARPADA